VAARFRFRLESLLKLRHSLEEEAQRGLARCLSQLEQARAVMTELSRAHNATVEGRRQTPNQPVDLDRWRASERYLVVLERRLLEGAQAVADAQALADAARKELIKAHQDHLMLLRLKERRQEQHALDSQRQEATEMDEIAVLRYRLGSASPSILPGI
jgi:flagellar export protein FliJ